MRFIPNEVYHVYNRGNNRQKIFFSPDNYCYFIKKLETHIKPVSDILSWCLMPNHFHLMLHANDSSCTIRQGTDEKGLQELPFQIGKLLSSYTQAINKQNKKTGSLFQQKTKSKPVTLGKNSNRYLINSIHYCHQNPWRAGLVEKIEDWPYSSFHEYCGCAGFNLCNKELMLSLTGLSLDSFYGDSYHATEGFDFEE